MKYSKTTNKQRRERGDWPHNGRMIWESQLAWMQEFRDKVTGVISYKPMFSSGKTYRKES
jgi:hypothetical protein